MRLKNGKTVFECWGGASILPTITKTNVLPDQLKNSARIFSSYVHKNFHPLLNDFTHEMKFVKSSVVQKYDSISLTVAFSIDVPMLPFIKGIKIECSGHNYARYCDDDVKFSSSSVEVYCYGASNKKYFKDKKTFSYLLRSDFARVLSSVVQMAYADSI